jgi:hypothetical protein
MAGFKLAFAASIAKALAAKPQVEAVVAKRTIDELRACIVTNNASSHKKVGLKVVESAHNYPNDANMTGTVTIAGATRLKISFDPRCRTESGFDILTLEDGVGKNRKMISGDCGVPRWQSFEIPGDTLKWKFTSDAQRNYWGYL